MKSRLLPLVIFPLTWSAAPALAQDYFCYMVDPAGQTIDMGYLCGVPGSQPPGPVGQASPASGPVIGGNELIPAVLDVQQDGGAWVVSGYVGNRGPIGITLRAVQFDILDGAGQVIYQGSIQPIAELSRVQAGTQQRVSTRIPARQIAGTPATVVPVEVRYVR